MMVLMFLPKMKTLQKMPMQYLLLKTDLTNWFAILEFDLKLMIKRLPQISKKQIASMSLALVRFQEVFWAKHPYILFRFILIQPS